VNYQGRIKGEGQRKGEMTEWGKAEVNKQVGKSRGDFLTPKREVLACDKTEVSSEWVGWEVLLRTIGLAKEIPCLGKMDEVWSQCQGSW